MVLLRVVADDQLRAVRRNSMVVVATPCESSINDLRSSACDSNLLDVPVPVKNQVLAVRHPVGRLEPPWSHVNRAPVRRGNGDDFERAVKRRSGPSGRHYRVQIAVREAGLFTTV